MRGSFCLLPYSLLLRLYCCPLFCPSAILVQYLLREHDVDMDALGHIRQKLRHDRTHRVRRIAHRDALERRPARSSPRPAHTGSRSPPHERIVDQRRVVRHHAAHRHAATPPCGPARALQRSSKRPPAAHAVIARVLVEDHRQQERARDSPWILPSGVADQPPPAIKTRPIGRVRVRRNRDAREDDDRDQVERIDYGTRPPESPSATASAAAPARHPR